MHIERCFTKSGDSRRAPFEAPILVAHQPEFLPWLGFISKATMGDVYLILDSVDFQKEYYQNRNKIRIKNTPGWQWLVIPVIRAKSHPMKTCEVMMSSSNWRQRHLRAIRYAYSRTPYFEEVYSDLERIYKYEGDSLVDFLVLLIKYAFERFGIGVPIFCTSKMIAEGYSIEGQKTDLVLSMCHAVGAKTFVAGKFGMTYLEKERFKTNNITLVFQSFSHPSYPQIQGAFKPNMAFIDILFNCGPKSVEILGKSDWEQ